MASIQDIKKRVFFTVNEVMDDRDVIVLINECLDDLSRVARLESNYIDILLTNVIKNGLDDFNVLNDKAYNKYVMNHPEDYGFFPNRNAAHFPKPKDFIRMVDIKIVKQNGQIFPINKTTISTLGDYLNSFQYTEANNKIYIEGNIQENDVVRFMYNCCYPTIKVPDVGQHASAFTTQELPLDQASHNAIVAFIVYKYRLAWSPQEEKIIDLALYEYNRQKTEFINEITTNRMENQQFKFDKPPRPFR